MSETRTGPGFSDFEDDYQVIRLSVNWGSTSIVAFAAVVILNMGGRFLGLGLFQIIGATLALSIAGFLLGLIGLKFGRGRGAARVGVFLNGVVLLCNLVILLVAFLIMRRPG